jgi:hypothetical protein
MTTNITADHRTSFEVLASGDYRNFALFSCFVNGEPAAAICRRQSGRRQLCLHAIIRQRDAVAHPDRP